MKKASQQKPFDDDQIPKHVRKSGKKSFVIERRYVGDSTFMSKYREWNSYWKKYETEQSRDKALKDLQQRSNSNTYGWKWEYRAKRD